MPTNIPAGQSRIVCWLGEDLSLPASSFNTASHTFSALSEVNGASQSWRAGRTLNSLPGSTLRKLSTYRVQAGSAALTLPDHATGNGGAIDLTRVANIPVADFTFTVSGGTVSFSPTGSTPGSGTLVLGYDWDFGDGSAIDFGNAPQHAYTAVGTYTVRLRVMNDMNTRSLWRSKTVTVTSVSPAPTPVPPGPSPTPPTPVPPSGTLFPTGAPSGYVQRSAVPNGTAIEEFWIGNSVSDTRKDATAGAGVASLASQTGYTHTYARHMVPGSPLQYLYESSATSGFTTSPYGFYPNALANYKWDIVTFQPFDRSADSDLQYIRLFLDIVAGSSQYANASEFPRPWIYQRWPRKSDTQTNNAAFWEAQYSRVYNPSQFFYECQNFFDTLLNLVRTNETRFKKALIIPVGDCMRLFNQRASTGQIPGFSSSFDLYNDGIHLTNTGAYFITMVFYSAFYYRSPVGLTVPTPYGTIDSSLVTLMQNLVWEVIQNHSQVAFIPSSEA